jgi:diphthamide biosynthesis protein 2
LAFNDLREFSLVHVIDYKQILPGGLHHKEFRVSSKPDTSLVSNRIRNISNSDITINNVLAHKDQGTLISNEVSSNCFYSKTWNGLEQKLGENNVRLAENGRDGIPINYENERL